MDIETLREAQKLTREQLADELGVSRQTIYAWEKGVQRPRLYLSQVKKLCKVLKCSLNKIDD